MITVATLVKWITDHRRRKGFVNFDRGDLACELARAAPRKELAFTALPNGEIKGVVLCKRDDTFRRLHIRDILTTDKRALPMLVGVFRSWYPGWSLTANRRGKFRCYATSKLLTRLTHERSH